MTPLSAAFEDTHRSIETLIVDSLRTVREHLGMEVAFVSEFTEGQRVFRYVDALSPACPVAVGGGGPLVDSYCQRVVDGRLPELICNAGTNAEALTLPVTRSLPVGAHLSIPLRFSSGRLFGTFCCFSTQPDESLNARDLDTMRLFADMVARMLEQHLQTLHQLNERKALIQATLDEQRFSVVYQPIVNVETQAIVGYEALARFSTEPLRSPDKWFQAALDVGMQEALELAVLRVAVQGLEHIPESAYISLNVSPETLLRGSIDTVLAGLPLKRIILEVTEHVSVGDYAPIATALEPLREQGLRLAVDDAGAGFASFRHILMLKPDIIKLDSSLIQRIDSHQGSRALAAALVRFAEETGCAVVAEGVETHAELAVLRELRVDNVQGYLLGRPAALQTLKFRVPRSRTA